MWKIVIQQKSREETKNGLISVISLQTYFIEVYFHMPNEHPTWIQIAFHLYSRTTPSAVFFHRQKVWYSSIVLVPH